MQLQEIAQVIRSKNAGPRCLTLDILFGDMESYERAVRSASLRADAVAKLYAVPEETLRVIPYPLGRAIKIVLSRPVMAGDPDDRDVYGAQQHAPLLGVEI